MLIYLSVQLESNDLGLQFFTGTAQPIPPLLASPSPYN